MIFTHKHITAALVIGIMLLASTFQHPAYSQDNQPANLIYDEAQTVYLGNLARREHGLPPLRWNRQLTEAARWFAHDSVERREEPYCGHQDTQGDWPDARARIFGYRGAAGAENAFCGYVTPEGAIQGWLDSPGHRDNLLADGHREIGLGYYRQSHPEGQGRGYIAQMFGSDPVYPPVIINNEALYTTAPQVNLYIYDRAPGGGFGGLGPAIEMQVSNEPSFAQASWEPFVTEKPWTLEPGTGWRTVYVKTRDAWGRTVVVQDVIYLGDTVPRAELGFAQMSSTQTQVTIPTPGWQDLPLVQFSPGWLADDTLETFGLNWGNGEQVPDSDAWGGTAFRLYPGAGESKAWVWTTEFVRDAPLTAYFRLKANDTSSSDEIARLSVSGGGIEYGPLIVRGTDFRRAGVYQEFALDFTYATTDDPFLACNIWRSGEADITFDAVSIFSAAQPVAPETRWVPPDGNQRGQGIWVRYLDNDGRFSPPIRDGTAETGDPPAPMSGDVNGDGIIDAGDIPAMVLRIFEGQFANEPGSDCNNDGVADAGDIPCVVLLVFASAG